MDHSDAIRLGAAEKYLLGELSPSLRAEFEDHYFDCPVCASDLESASLFLAAAQKVLRKASSPVPAGAPLRTAQGLPVLTGWFAWLRPAVVVPAFVVLLLLIGYQSFVTIPHWQKLAASSAAPRLLHPFYLHAGTSRSGEPAFRVPARQPFQLFLDIPSDPRFSSYLLRLQDASGIRRDLLSLPISEAGKTSLIQMPSDLRPGKYDLVVLGLPLSGNPSSASEISRSSFFVEISGRIEQH